MFEFSSQGIIRQSLITLPPALNYATTSPVTLFDFGNTFVRLINVLSYVNNATVNYDYVGNFELTTGTTSQYRSAGPPFNLSINVDGNSAIRSFVDANFSGGLNNQFISGLLQLTNTGGSDATVGDGEINFLLTYYLFNI